MADVLISCAGVRTKALTIPPFVLRTGEAVCMHLPSPLADDAEADLIRVLTGARPAQGYCPSGRILAALPAFDDSKALWRLLRPTRAAEWLRRRTRLSQGQAVAAIRRMGLDPEQPLNRLAGNPRLLLGLEAAWAGGADAIVFGTAGCDPCGVQAAFTAAAARLRTCGAIYLSRLIFQDGRLLRDHFPGATCVELRAPSAMPLPAKTA